MSAMNLNPEQYTDLCNLIETLWENRRKKDYHATPDIDNLSEFVSPQSRAVVNLIQQILWRGEA